MTTRQLKTDTVVSMVQRSLYSLKKIALCSNTDYNRIWPILQIEFHIKKSAKLPK